MFLRIVLNQSTTANESTTRATATIIRPHLLRRRRLPSSHRHYIAIQPQQHISFFTSTRKTTTGTTIVPSKSPWRQPRRQLMTILNNNQQQNNYQNKFITGTSSSFFDNRTTTPSQHCCFSEHVNNNNKNNIVRYLSSHSFFSQLSSSIEDTILDSFRPHPILSILRQRRRRREQQQQPMTLPKNNKKINNDNDDSFHHHFHFLNLLPHFNRLKPHVILSAFDEILKDHYHSCHSFLKRQQQQEQSSIPPSFNDLIIQKNVVNFDITYVSQLLSLLVSVGGIDGRGDDVKDYKEMINNLSQRWNEYVRTNVVVGDYERLCLLEVSSRLLLRYNDDYADDEDDNRRDCDDDNNDKQCLRRRILQNIYHQYHHQKLLSEDPSIHSHYQSLRHDVIHLENTFKNHHLGDVDCLFTMSEILRKKHTMAVMLGYENHAHQSLTSRVRMARSWAEVRELHEMVAERSLRRVLEQEEEEDDDVSLWDNSNEDLSNYFEFESVLQGLFHLSRRLFDVTIEEIPTTTTSSTKEGFVNVWHPDVRFFHVYDNCNDCHLGSFFLDPFVRPYKEGGEWVVSLLERQEMIDVSGGVIPPVVVMSCYIEKEPGDNTAVLMRFDQVKGLFHEFGHVCEHLLANGLDNEGRDCGSVMEEDMTEFLSQFMEYWLYDKNTLSTFAHHYKTGEVLPPSLISHLKYQLRNESPHLFLRQIFMAELEIELHSLTTTALDDDDNDDGDALRLLQSKLYEKYYAPLMDHSTVDDDNNDDSSSSSHNSHLLNDCLKEIFLSNINAAMSTCIYRYLYSRVMSADAFMSFVEVGLDNDVEVMKQGRLMRRVVLKYGMGGVKMRELFRRWRGRDVRVEALLRFHGFADDDDE